MTRSSRNYLEPFRPIYRKPKFPLVINTLLVCLNEDEISSLIPYKIDFPINKPPLFEYGKYVRRIDQDFVKQNIITWLNPSEGYDVDRHQDYRVQKLMDVIYHMILRQGSNIQKFKLNVSQNDSYIDLPKVSTFITFNPGITDLRSLNMEIDLGHNHYMSCQNTIEFLTIIPTFCRNIINCDLWIFKLNKIFVKPFLDIIQLQPLERVLICIVNIEENAKKIIKALEFRSETLKELLFECLDFRDIDLSFISNLKRLERLKFIYCKGFISHHYEFLSDKKFQLKELKLWHSGLDDLYDRFDDTMIKSLGGESLNKLSLNIITLETIRTIHNSLRVLGIEDEFDLDDEESEIIEIINSLKEQNAYHKIPLGNVHLAVC
uniref:Uncharacterized protein n=1 Tax=Rhizophagus irregularis (strain DAOM 181602 / DAOM 197198 / MUCL 43194) TaxID=747089 RepID=U9TZ54_RHIID